MEIRKDYSDIKWQENGKYMKIILTNGNNMDRIRRR